MRLLLTILLIVMFRSVAIGNAGVFGGFGSDLRLINSSDIQMVSERVLIKLVPSEYPVTGELKHLDEARFDCVFKLRNLTEKSVKIRVGFPVESDNVLMRIDSVASYKFSASSGDKSYDVKFARNDGDKKFNTIFLWDMSFQPCETLELRVSYRTYGYVGLGLTQDKPYDFSVQKGRAAYFEPLQSSLAQYYGYVVTTGKSWAGKIENAEFILDFGEFEQYLEKRGYLANDKDSPYKSHYKEEPFYNGALSRILTPSGWKREGDKMVLKFAPFEAKENISIRYDFTVFPTTPEGFDKLINYIMKSKKRIISENSTQNSEENYANVERDIADIVLEFYGIKTGNPEIEKFLKKQSWYKNEDREYPTISEALRVRLESRMK